MKSTFEVIRVSLKAEISSCMAYRVDFFISVVLVFIGELILPVVVLLIYSSGASFPGWDLYQVLLLQGVFLFSKGIVNVLFSGVVFNTLSRVREGTFDLLLIKPRGTLFMAIVTGIDIESIGSLFSGIALFSLALVHIPIVGVSQVLLFIFFFIISILVLFSFNILSAAVVFKWVGNSRIFELFDSVINFGMYPKSIFSTATQNILSYIIPVAAISYFPATILLGKNPEGIILSSIIALIFMLFSMIFWNIMLKHYTSAGG